MKALVRDRYGSADVLAWEEIDAPMPAGDQVLVRVQAASLNAADLDFLHGEPRLSRVVIGIRGPRNRRLGVDVAGTVEAVGEDVTRFRPGDAVFADMYGYGMGSFADYVCAAEKAFVTKPESMTFEEAATLPHAGILALQGLRAGRAPRPGERFLMNGASGNVGPFAVQIAKALGMHVTGVASTPKLDFVRSIGADEVLDYTRDDFATDGRRWDRILDVSASHSMFEVRRSLAPDGVYTWLGGSAASLAGALAFGAATSFGGRQRIGFTFAWKPFHAPDVATLVRSFEDGSVKPVIDRGFPLREAIDAIRYMDEGRARGKVVLLS